MRRLLHASTLANPSVRNDGVEQWEDCFGLRPRNDVKEGTRDNEKE